MHICVLAYTCIRTHTLIHTCTNTHKHICIHTSIHPSIHPSIHTYIHPYKGEWHCPTCEANQNHKSKVKGKSSVNVPSRKRERDPDAPKAPKTAYILFVQEMQVRLMHTYEHTYINPYNHSCMSSYIYM